jgi:phage-related protein
MHKHKVAKMFVIRAATHALGHGPLILLGSPQETENNARHVACLLRRSTSELALKYKKLYISRMADTKPIEFRGKSLDDLRDFPLPARREAGHQLDLVQNGQEPDDWKPMHTVGQGVKEIRIRDAAGAFRVIYVAKFADAVYVLHCFQKKTEKTSKTDLDLAAKRYRDLLKELNP